MYKRKENIGSGIKRYRDGTELEMGVLIWVMIISVGLGKRMIGIRGKSKRMSRGMKVVEWISFWFLKCDGRNINL
ncbi:hypothetical protein [Staphylococcus epidermidis]|uniref:hypothetical protein n=1 Tax=Staphylococcus epidermidis TaxID=1282 RepID=UPI001C934A45|nr:hypothetical protein [Staphylococcus epidermidis]